MGKVLPMNTLHIGLRGVASPFSIKSRVFFNSYTQSAILRFPSFKCCSSSKGSEEKQTSKDDDGDDSKNALSLSVSEQVEVLLSREENKVLLDGLEEASQRVQIARRELELIQKQQLAAKQFRDYINQLEGKALEIAECQREISQAKALVEEAERSLSLNEDGLKDGDAFIGNESEDIDRDEERWESVKAASLSAFVGTLAGLPICFTQVTNSTQLILPLAINFISCALFGVTFRYAIRRNLDDVQLKTGVAAGFGVVKGLATLGGGPLLELNFESLLSHAQDGTIYVFENLFIFVFAAVGLDFCFKTRLLSPFPIDRSVSIDNSK